MDTNNTKMVEFDQYCKTCKHKNDAETDDHCDECLENPVNIGSKKPVFWTEK